MFPLLLYLTSVLFAYSTIRFYFKKIDLDFDGITVILILLPLFNIGAGLGAIYCIATKRHY